MSKKSHPIHSLGDVRIAYSGGGLRSLTASAVFTSVLKELTIWDKVTYLAGVSGGSWHVGTGCNTNYSSTALSKASKELDSGVVGAGAKTAINAVRSIFTLLTDGAEQAMQQLDKTKGLTFGKMLNAVRYIRLTETVAVENTKRLLICFETDNGNGCWMDGEVQLSCDGSGTIELLRYGDKVIEDKTTLSKINLKMAHIIDVKTPDGNSMRESKSWIINAEVMLAAAGSAFQLLGIDSMALEIPGVGSSGAVGKLVGGKITTTTTSSCSAGGTGGVATIAIRDAGIHGHGWNIPIRNLARKPTIDRSKPLTIIALDNGSDTTPMQDFELHLDKLAVALSWRLLTSKKTSSTTTTGMGAAPTSSSGGSGSGASSSSSSSSRGPRVEVSSTCVIYQFAVPPMNIIYLSGDNNPNITSGLYPSKVDPRALATQFAEDLLSALSFLSSVTPA